MNLGASSSDYSSSTLLAQLLQAANSQRTAPQSGTAVESANSTGQGGMRSLFADIDSDGDGLVSAAEFTKFSDQFSAEASSALLQAQAGAGESSEKFASLDTNGDGSLDQSEFEAGMPPPPPPPPGGDVDSLAASLLSSFDTDGDGEIGSEELQAALSQTDAAGDEDVASLLSALDADGNGSISEDELKTGLASLQPPPPPPSEGESGGTAQTASAGSASGASSAGAAEEESYDPLDTNEDGFVSMAERLAGMRAGLVSGSLSSGTMAALLQSVSDV